MDRATSPWPESIPCETSKTFRYRREHKTEARPEMQGGMTTDMATVRRDSTNQHGTARTEQALAPVVKIKKEGGGSFHVSAVQFRAKTKA